jgi:hypothetical protein
VAGFAHSTIIRTQSRSQARHGASRKSLPALVPQLDELLVARPGGEEIVSREHRVGRLSGVALDEPREGLMAIRTTLSTVTFAHPFLLTSIAEEQPAGTYTVETDEEMLQTARVPAYRRIATLIRLPGRPGSSVLGYVADIDAAELAAALDRDAVVPE